MDKTRVNEHNTDFGLIDKAAARKTGERQTAILPNLWRGEVQCLVGPFSSKDVADYFADVVVNRSKYEVLTQAIFAKGNAWFIKVGSA